MATLTAFTAYNFNNFDLRGYDYLGVVDDADLNYFGAIYEDMVIYTKKDYDEFDELKEFHFTTLGSGITEDPTTGIIGGTVTCIAESDGDTVDDYWIMTGFSIDAKSLFDTVYSGKTSQSTNLLEKILLSGDDTINMSAFADLAAGFAGNDTINGNDGDDRLYGGAGNDTISGGIGKDYLAGDGGNDTITGNDGDDTIFGNAGQDSLFGNLGADKFCFKLKSDSANGASRDVIFDFSSSQLDVIVLEGIDANTRKSGDQDFKFIGSKGFSDIAGELRFVGSILSGDVNGDGKADFQIEIAGVTSLVKTDFDL